MAHQSIPKARTIPTWTATLGALKAQQAIVRQYCAGCDFKELANVNTLIRQKGEDWSLWDWRPACPKCGGQTYFHCSPGRGTPSRPMLTG